MLVTDHHFDDLAVEERLLDGVARVEELADSSAERQAQFSNAAALLVSQYAVDADRIATLEHCRVVSRYGIGVDTVDVEAATGAGIWVANAPTYGIEEVATHAVAMLLSLARQLDAADDVLAAGGWRTAPPEFSDPRAPEGTRSLPIHRLSTRTVGFVGFGNIGRAVAGRLRGFEPRMLVYDPYVDAGDVPDEVSLVDLETVLAESDFVTVHSPLTDETRGLLDRATLAAMKDSAYLVNCARGGIVDEDALVAALDAGELAGAALDVFEAEPLPEGHPLRDHDRVLTTPHIAYYSEESDVERREQAVANVRAVLSGERPPYPVNDLK